ncbi:MAG: DUF2383 domain-containing protein [Fuerstia sp.]|nr:DUF2383 domain-containing protein [Fuerstiella sp.]
MIMPLVALELSRLAVSQLQGLVKVNIDSRNAYRAAMGCIADEDISAAFRRTASDRQKQATALQEILWASLEETVEFRPANSDPPFRLWTELKGSREQGLGALLSEAVRIEVYVQSQYASVIATIQGRAIRQLLLEQLASVQSVQQRMTAMRDTVSKQMSQLGIENRSPEN